LPPDDSPAPLAHPIVLGAFEIQRFLGRGGMGVVWLGQHREQGVPVAIKVLPQRLAREPLQLAAFRDEVRRVAQFTHPGIVVVFDYGDVPAAAAEASRSSVENTPHDDLALEEGSPYLVMEFCERGSLADRPRPLPWNEIRSNLLALLDALAHAHARGVVHRDVKPANVLFAVDDSGRSLMKLTDFGISLAAMEDEEGHRVDAAGTLPYMAPEQFSDWRDQGPWTDLYALGCVAFEMATGEVPFRAETAVAFISQHLFKSPPPMKTGADVPPDFEAWVSRLLAKEPVDRFACAADAAYALTRLPESSRQPQHSTAHQLTTLVFSEWLETVPFDDGMESENTAEAAATLLNGAAGSDDDDAREPVAALPAPLPSTWRQDNPARAPMKLIGAGIGLYEWRTVPLVGREDERHRAWQALMRVTASRHAEAIFLRGQAGYGKSRLAEWIAQRAAEVGAVTVVLRADNGPIQGPNHGLGHGLSQFLRCGGLDSAALLARISSVLEAKGAGDEYDAAALTEIMAGDGTSGVRFNSPRERYVVMRRLLRLLSPDRPLLLWLEDVHWGRDDLGFVHHLLAEPHESPLPLLVLATVRDDLLPERPVELDLVNELLGIDERVDAVDIGPLGWDEQDELMQHLLHLEGKLANRVRKRTGGNPLFAVQLVGDWIRRGVLQVGRTGFELAPGEKAEIPTQIHKLWSGKIEQVLDGLPSGASEALHVAAALGREVDRVEWQRACAVLGAGAPPALTEALLDAHLFEPRPDGWAFCHGMLRESIRHVAAASGRWQPVNLACAEALGDGAAVRGTAERMGRHLVEASQLEDSLGPLLQGANENLGVSDYRTADDLLDLGERCLRQLDVPQDDERWARGWLARIRVLVCVGDFERAASLAAQCAESARRFRWREIYPKALRLQGNTRLKQGQLGLAETVLVRAQMEAMRAGQQYGEAQCLLNLATISRMLGDLERAREHGEEALAVFEQLEDPMGIAETLSELGNVQLAAGDLIAAEDHLRRGLKRFEQIGYPYGIASTRNSLGDILRSSKRLDDAEAEYREVLLICERIGEAERVVPMLNQALLQLELRRFDDAEALLTRGLRIVEAEGRRHLQAYFHSALLACSAHCGDWIGWDAHIVAAEALVAETGARDADIAEVAELAGQLAARAGEQERAARAYQFVHAQWAAIGREDRAQDITQRLHGV
jgi:eukaryotic-like serine/threonine-protein kinase